jgi:hypothetical protein
MLNKIKFAAIASGALMLTLSIGSEVALAEPMEIRYNSSSNEYELVDVANGNVENITFLEEEDLVIDINRNGTVESAISYNGNGRYELISFSHPITITQEVDDGNQAGARHLQEIKKLYRRVRVLDRQTGEEINAAVRVRFNPPVDLIYVE